MIQAETERDTIRKEAATAREEAARLRGQVEVLQTQAADLMRALAALHAAEGEAKPATPPVKGKKSE
ncbi:hypothetical protein [Nitrosospira sp. Nsp1]|uniref:hypothetical protein n=1 Tax=Nitrosospira sp. Nsp1 TaxID=136547 RepID=UPI000888C707|nr:hypothetical protein [Nitrosospira sp. Nsp1]SCX38564.1 hypothetical protein SAMN05720354_10239 [Nitrosospira sp. Nsp1]